MSARSLTADARRANRTDIAEQIFQESAFPAQRRRRIAIGAQVNDLLHAGPFGRHDIARLIEQSRAVLARAEAARNNATKTEEENVADANAAQAGAGDEEGTPTVINLFISFPSPDAAAFDAAISAVRGTPGIRGASVSSTAIGGSSVLSVTYAGSQDELVGALAQRGYNVQRAGNSLNISR